MERIRKALVNRRTGIAAAAVAVFGTSVFLGREFGTLNSPDYTTEASGAQFMLSNVEIYEKSDHAVEMDLHAGVYLYRYSSETPGDVRRQLSPPWRGIPGIPRRWKTEELDRVARLVGIGAAPAGILGSLAAFGHKVETYSRPAKVWWYVIATAVAGSGGVIGYYMTYSDTADYDNANFRKGLENPSYWDGLARDVMLCQAFDVINNLRKSEKGTHQEPTVPDATKPSLDVDAAMARCERFREWMQEKAPLIKLRNS